MSFEFDRRHVAKRFVNSPVVEPFDVVKCRPFDVFYVAPGALAVNQFSFVETVDTLR